MAIPGQAHSSYVKKANAYQSMYRRLLTACAALVLCAAAAAEQARPNIVFLLADDLGYADLSVYGSPHIQTPHLDGLAKGGLRFTDFYAASAVCSPSRAATLTGRFSVRVGVYSWILGPMQAGGGQNEPHKMHLPADETTIAGYLKRAGYATGHFGKWHLGGALVQGVGAGPNPGDHGFDHWLATENNAAPSHRNPANFIRNGERVGEIEDIGDIKATALTNFQLFNLRRDIGQDRDVAAEHPEVLAEMKRKLTELHAEVVEEAPDWRAWKW